MTINERIAGLKEKYGTFRNFTDFNLFTLMCIRDYFFLETGEPFDPDEAAEWITDGANDGGIDAIFNDPNSDGRNDIIIIQSKYYNGALITVEEVCSELAKIKCTLVDLENGRDSNYSEKMLRQYTKAMDQKGDGGSIRIFFFTSGTMSPDSKDKARGKVENLIQDYKVEFLYKEDIMNQIEICESPKKTVDHGDLKLDKEGNALCYKDSVIVNISAASLKKLYRIYGKRLLELNLRYFVSKAEVDKGISDSVKNRPEDFWYLNNGIVIVCDDYRIDGQDLHLENFSIINGGQTTARITSVGFSNDFYLHCKVVKAKRGDKDENDKFVASIAHATNSQKPISAADLVANSEEQVRLKQRFAQWGIDYQLKNGVRAGDKPDYLTPKIEHVGKIGLAAIMQMPGSVLGRSPIMFKEDIYKSIFEGDVPAGVLADGLRITHCFKEFSKQAKDSSGYSKSEHHMLAYGVNHVLAIMAFFAKLKAGAFSQGEVSGALKDPGKLKGILMKNGNMQRIIKTNQLAEGDELFDFFGCLVTEYLTNAYQEACMELNDPNSAPSVYDFLKKDRNYLKYIIPGALKAYRWDRTIKTMIDTLLAAE